MSNDQQPNDHKVPTFPSVLGVSVPVAIIYFFIILLIGGGEATWLHGTYFMIFLVTAIIGGWIGGWLSKKWYGVLIGAFLMSILGICIIFIFIWKVFQYG